MPLRKATEHCQPVQIIRWCDKKKILASPLGDLAPKLSLPLLSPHLEKDSASAPLSWLSWGQIWYNVHKSFNSAWNIFWSVQKILVPIIMLIPIAI